MLDYAALKAADAALSPPIEDPAAAAAALNAQTRTSEPTDFPALEALHLLLLTGEWASVIVRSEQRPLTPAVVSALGAVALLQERGVIRASIPASWQSFQSALGALHAAGDISDQTVQAIFALRTPTLPVWPVSITDNDVIAARSL